MNGTSDLNSRIGWRSQPDGRGTLDIVWNCCLSMFLSSWSILCLNVPGPHETKWQVLWRKLALTALGILCPEVIFVFAYSQWLHARQSVRDFRSLSPATHQGADETNGEKKKGYLSGITQILFKPRVGSGWTMKEAFFAEMGGFRLRSTDHPPFPIDSKQVLFLVSKGHVSLPTLDEREIEDKNKADGLLRTITLGQILWFIVNPVGRWAQDLTVTTLELTTVSFILCSSTTAFFWWRKPADVFLPKYIESSISMLDLLRAENQTDSQWYLTPLDFVGREEWWWSRCWINMLNILRIMRFSFGSDIVPIDRIADTRQKFLSRKQQVVIACLNFICLAVLVAAWNHNFPTRTELILWRIASLMLIADNTILVLLFLFLELPTIWTKFLALIHISIKSPVHNFRSQRPRKTGSMFHKIDQWLDCVRNNSLSKDPHIFWHEFR